LQYDKQSLVTALMNDKAISIINEMFEDSSDSLDINLKDGDINENDKNDFNAYIKSQNNNRRRTQKLQSTLPYPTSVYSIFSTRPRWTASCSIERMSEGESTSQCFTAEINFEVKYRGSTEQSKLIEEYIQSIIHNQVALDPTQLFAEHIIGLTWKTNEEASRVFLPEADEVTLTPIFFRSR
jgi:hypothetical protein